MTNLKTEQLRRLARLGAMARLEQLQQEEAAIKSAFPELFGRRRGGGRRGSRRARRAAAGGTRRRRKMSAAARKAVSDRMRKYWAERRKSKAAK